MADPENHPAFFRFSSLNHVKINKNNNLHTPSTQNTQVFYLYRLTNEDFLHQDYYLKFGLDRFDCTCMLFLLHVPGNYDKYVLLVFSENICIFILSAKYKLYLYEL